MQQSVFCRQSAILLAVGIALAFGATNTDVWAQNHSSEGPAVFEAGVATHQTAVDPKTLLGFATATEPTVEGEIETGRPTRSTFMATWRSVKGARGYLLDVSTDP